MRSRFPVLLTLVLSLVFIIAAHAGRQADEPSADDLRRRPQPARMTIDSDGDIRAAAALLATTINVDAIEAVRTVPEAFPGINAAIWDSTFESRTTITLLESMGTNLLRFPGGSLSDEYHWRTNTTLNNTWTWATSFDDFAGVALAVGSQAIITVNYGTGTADEAAGWVEYSNLTKGYGFKYWEIGNENYGTWETDTRAIRHDPFTYAHEARDYIAAMKAVDPTIKVGVVITTGEDSFANNRSHPATNPRTGLVHNGWTPVLLTTLKSLNVVPDFAIYHRYEQNPSNESDAGLLQSAATWRNDASNLRQQLTDYLGADGARVELVCTENNSVSFDPGKQTTSLVNGLFLADSVGSILQTEFNMFVWWDMGNGYVLGTNNSPALYGWRNYGDYGITSVDDEPYPTYYVSRLLSYFAAPGDTIVNATSQSSLLAVYAAKKGDGRIGLLLINKSRDEEITAQIALAGFVPSNSAVVRSYGKRQDDAARTLAGSPDISETVFNGASVNFAYTLPPYSVTVMSLLPETNDFDLAATPSSYALNPGSEARFELSAAFSDGLSEPATLTATAQDGAPLGVDVLQSRMTPLQKAVLVVRPQAGAMAQTYNVTVAATSGSVQRTTTLPITLLSPPLISSAVLAGKRLTITADEFGELPRVFINGIEQTERIKRIKGEKIILKGKRSKLGLVVGVNSVRLVRGQAFSEFALRI